MLILLNCVHSDSSTWHHVIILISLFVSSCHFQFSVLFCVSILFGDKQEFKFGCVMSILYTNFIPMFYLYF